MSGNPYCVTTGDGLVLNLHRFPVKDPTASVLLLHGGSASAQTFVTPAAHNLVDYLNAQPRFDVWTFDWRGSNQVQMAHVLPTIEFSMNAAARFDLPAAFQKIREVMTQEGRGDERLAAFGHCLGGGVLAAALATRTPTGDSLLAPFRLRSVVLSALGLFYASPWDGWVKVQDYILEQVLENPKAPRTIDVHVPNVFPPPMDDSYVLWPKTLQFDCGVEICRQLSFMFGHPYLEQNLAPGIHTNLELEVLFNRMPLTLFKHCGQNLRRGVYAALDRSEDLLTLPNDDKPCAEGFEMPVTLITGERNMLWHRESIDRMYEWMHSNGKRDCKKFVLAGFAHQDLLWGKGSPNAVFPKIARGLS